MIGQSIQAKWVATSSLRHLLSTGFSIANRNFLSGGEIHAAAADTLLRGNYLSTVGLLPRIVAGFAPSLCVVTRRRLPLPMVCRGSQHPDSRSGNFPHRFPALFTSNHLWLPFVSIETCLLAALPAGSSATAR